jgi:hypothetical protein
MGTVRIILAEVIELVSSDISDMRLEDELSLMVLCLVLGVPINSMYGPLVHVGSVVVS